MSNPNSPSTNQSPTQPTVPSQSKKLKKRRSIPQHIFDFLSGYLLCVITLIVLGLIVWLSTLEQTQIGLSAAADKYYDSSVTHIIPTLNKKNLPIILPGAYWTCVVLFINMFLGGIVRIRKNVKQIGPIISHIGILLLLVAGFVDHHTSIHGRMDIRTIGTSDYAWKQKTPSLEVFAYDKDQNKEKPFVIKHQMLEDLEHDRRTPKFRTFTFKDLPFDIEVRKFYNNALVGDENKHERTKKDGPVVDGYFLHPVKVNAKDDFYRYACYVTVKPKNGTPDIQLLLSRTKPHPVTFTIDNTLYGIEMPNEIWLMPYEITLINSKGVYYPDTDRPSHFSSKITWHSKDDKTEKTSSILMNEPLRYRGYTLYQAHHEQPTDGIQYSGFEIVTNPADQWPFYCLLISALGLLIHFGIKFVEYLDKESRKAAKK